MLLGGKTILAIGEAGLALIDSATNATVQMLDLKGDRHDAVVMMPPSPSPSARATWPSSTAAAKVTAHVSGLADPVAAAIVPR